MASYFSNRWLLQSCQMDDYLIFLVNGKRSTFYSKCMLTLIFWLKDFPPIILLLFGDNLDTFLAEANIQNNVNHNLNLEMAYSDPDEYSLNGVKLKYKSQSKWIVWILSWISCLASLAWPELGTASPSFSLSFNSSQTVFYLLIY